MVLNEFFYSLEIKPQRRRNTEFHTDALCFSVPLCLCGSKKLSRINSAQECDATEI